MARGYESSSRSVEDLAPPIEECALAATSEQRFAHRSWRGMPVRGLTRQFEKMSPAERIALAKRARIFRKLGELTPMELDEVEQTIERLKKERIGG